MIGEAVLVIALGVAAGAAAGLFGVGGGIIFVPTLTLVLGLGQLQAEATSLLAIVPVAVLGSWRQTRTGLVRWRDAATIGLASVATVVAGALVADAAPERALRIGFAVLLVLTAIQLVADEVRAGGVGRSGIREAARPAGPQCGAGRCLRREAGGPRRLPAWRCPTLTVAPVRRRRSA